MTLVLQSPRAKPQVRKNGGLSGGPHVAAGKHMALAAEALRESAVRLIERELASLTDSRSSNLVSFLERCLDEARRAASIDEDDLFMKSQMALEVVHAAPSASVAACAPLAKADWEMAIRSREMATQTEEVSWVGAAEAAGRERGFEESASDTETTGPAGTPGASVGAHKHASTASYISAQRRERANQRAGRFNASGQASGAQREWEAADRSSVLHRVWPSKVETPQKRVGNRPDDAERFDRLVQHAAGKSGAKVTKEESAALLDTVEQLTHVVKYNVITPQRLRRGRSAASSVVVFENH